jgi:hypothetical protein
MVGVSPFKGRLMDEIPDAEYKVVEHQIAPPLDPSARWRFQRLARGTGSGLDDASYAELVKPSTEVQSITVWSRMRSNSFGSTEPLAGPGNAGIGGALVSHLDPLHPWLANFTSFPTSRMRLPTTVASTRISVSTLCPARVLRRHHRLRRHQHRRQHRHLSYGPIALRLPRPFAITYFPLRPFSISRTFLIALAILAARRSANVG